MLPVKIMNEPIAYSTIEALDFLDGFLSQKPSQPFGGLRDHDRFVGSIASAVAVSICCYKSSCVHCRLMGPSHTRDALSMCEAVGFWQIFQVRFLTVSCLKNGVPVGRRFAGAKPFSVAVCYSQAGFIRLMAGGSQCGWLFRCRRCRHQKATCW